jgi:replicative DNA helicase
LSVPIIALSQLSRAVETRKESKMPQLSDLRESGAIEQDADMVMFIYRPEYYEVKSNEMGESTHGETHIRIAKHRNGSLETVKLRANLAIQRFEEWEEGGGGFPAPGSNFKSLGAAPPAAGGDGAKFYLQKGSKMNEADFDQGYETEQPF